MLQHAAVPSEGDQPTAEGHWLIVAKLTSVCFLVLLLVFTPYRRKDHDLIAISSQLILTVIFLAASYVKLFESAETESGARSRGRGAQGVSQSAGATDSDGGAAAPDAGGVSGTLTNSTAAYAQHIRQQGAE